MPKQPQRVEIRGYQVGFGDCFLMTFVYSENDKRHVLIDFGTTELRKGVRPSLHMPIVAKAIKEACGGEKGQLTAVVATHRHADHISGFGTETRTGKSGEIIRGLKPKVVIQPWTEDPRAAKDAKKTTSDSKRSRKSFVGGLAAMSDIATSIANLTQRKPTWMSASLHKELQFLGMDNIANKSAIENLIAMGKARGATAVFARHGSKSGLERHLPGVKVRVLGPPDLTQTEKIKSMRSKDPDQFWHLLAGLNAGKSSLRGVGGGKTKGGSSALPPDARWFRSRLDRIRGQQLLEIVRSLDDQMNNTSLIILFEVFGKKLLFPGDAQIENWSWALQDAPDSKKTLELLSEVDVYKVGHHGSLNATPKTLLWENFKKRKKGGKLKTLLSTMPGKHGRPAKGTEVPRRTLLRALEEETTLLNTHKLDKNLICYELTIDP